MLLLLVFIFKLWIAAVTSNMNISSDLTTTIPPCTLPPQRNDNNFSIITTAELFDDRINISCSVVLNKEQIKQHRFQFQIAVALISNGTTGSLFPKEKENTITLSLLYSIPDSNALGDEYRCILFDSNINASVQEEKGTIPRKQTVVVSNSATNHQPVSQKTSYIGLFILFVALIGCGVVVYLYIKSRANNNERIRRCDLEAIGEFNAAYSHQEINNLLYDQRYEVEARNLEKLECIGGGHFGTVFNGKFKVSQQWPSNIPYEGYPPNTISVAIKVPGDEKGLSDYTTCECILFDELKILCNVGLNPNIVTLIGAITTSNNMCIVVEKCSNGSLLNFLKSKRESFVPAFNHNRAMEELRVQDHLSKEQSTELSAAYTVPTNKAQSMSELSIGLTTSHLLSFSMQIALGMKHLTTMKCLHRDLAARNVLVTENMICKIADFGLAKRVNRKDYYRVATNYDLPVRWMSREAITDSKFTVESDIWSYGILLYEMFALGGCPYPSVSNSEVTEAVKNGLQNEQPEFCPSLIYTQMQKCWDVDPEKRPSFANSADFFRNVQEITFASQQMLHNVEQELTREQHLQSILESLRFHQ